ncbi:hybrid sensor histidine kinase/response regulator transcription factor [Chryseolinea lacunae]|uniref:histidine kinase n=1 Tax=Chryseolinea lacunae TaxID=2801331 RepID=A0ABS1L277_9BACT|nr:hybrid sensor histidine kinase/response regulator transcription factor [Chryseolinea lacunae]MBL0745795.1 response regulator [Chryseolinea lacunae]
MICLTLYMDCAWGQIPSAISFDKLSVKHGLSQVSVMSIFRDSNGYLWFGTRDGLNRYDGLIFKVYRHEAHQNSISNNYVRSMDEDANNILWIATEDGLNALDQSTGNFKAYTSNPNSADELSDNQVLSVLCASNGDLWVGTENGLNLKKKNSEKFIKFFTNRQGAQIFTDNHVYSLFEDQSHRIWIGTRFGGLYCYDPNRDRFTHFEHNPADTTSLSSSFVTAIAEDRYGAIWIGTSKGLNLVNVDGVIQHIYHNKDQSNTLSNDFIRALAFDKIGNLWIASYNGLNYLETNKRAFRVYQKESWNPRSISDNSIRSLLIDPSGFLWVGTYFGGINIVNPSLSSFLLVGTSPSNQNSLSNYTIGSMAEDDKGNIWIGSEGGGLFYLDRKTQKVESIKTYYGKPIDLYTIKSLLFDSQGNLWVGTYLHGLFMLDGKNKTVSTFNRQKGSTQSISDNTVVALVENSPGDIWIGTDAGLNRYDYKTKRISSVPLGKDSTNKEPSIACLSKDRSGTVWIGTKTNGLFRYSSITKVQRYVNIPNHPGSLSNNSVYSVYEDLNGNLWVGTYGGGLNLMNKDRGEFKRFTTRDGLVNDIVYGITEDHWNSLWITTPSGISKCDPVNMTFKNYTPSNGIPIDEINENSLLKHSSGTMFIGGLQGLLAFNPDKITDNTIEPKLTFRNLKVFNRAIVPNDDTGILKTSLEETQNLEFTHDQNVFTIEYGAFDYPNAGANRYAYKLEGFDKEWNYVGQTMSATYTNLDPGTYSFKVRAANGDGHWSKEIKSINIVKLSPFWKTPWAFAAYFAIGTLLLYIARRVVLIRLQLENKLDLEHLEKEQMEKLTKLRLDFFTNISHDFRTPLTLIHASVEDMMKKTQNADLQKALTAIKRNVAFMLRLISQLMYFRKIENENTPLHVSRCTVTPFVKEVMESFAGIAHSRNIEYNIDSEIPDQRLYMDREKMEKVLYNILSNAFKFTPDGGHIYITVRLVSTVNEKEDTTQFVEIGIRNSGVGIHENDLKNIFTRFYQGESNHKQGTGIGLSIAKALIELHQGYLTAQSVYGEYAKFLIGIPITDAFTETQKTKSPTNKLFQFKKKWSVPQKIRTRQYSLLIVEDNLELRDLLEEKFSEDFDVMTAANGEEALMVIENSPPSIVISDIVMPRMTGLELVKMIKREPRTCHIPVLLLTEKGEEETAKEGYTAGADDFISKPFDVDTLKYKISNLVISKEKLREYSRKEVLLKDNQVNSASLDERFLEKLSDYVRQHIADPELTIVKAGKDLGLSRVHLYRKVKAVTGKSPVEFIRDFRLSVAAQLLEQHYMNVNEVCDAVGFQDLNYFRKMFKQKYNVVPKDYAKANNSEKMHPSEKPDAN